MDKRIVLEHMKGPHTGLRAILGRESQLNLNGASLPHTVPVDFIDRQGTATYVDSRRSYILYRED